MAGAAPRLMETDEFLVWCLRREGRYELVEGVPIEMITGASGMHDRLVTNLIIALGNQLRGGSWRPTTADVAVRTKIRSLRRPDVTVTCDPPRPDVYEAREPRMVIEVLSPSNTGVAWDRKMREYRRREGLDYILIVDSDIAAATLYTREGSTWEDTDFVRLSDVVELPRLGCRLPMDAIYADTGLKEDPDALGG